MIKKTRGAILSDMQERLRYSTDITNINPGSVARTFLDVITEEFYEYYGELELTVAMGFVSTAAGTYLDMIGKLLDCERIADENDTDYRARITNQVYVVAGANLTSIRVRALAADGVRDVRFKEYSHGAGSFSCFVLAENVQDQTGVTNRVRNIINEAKGYGVYADVRSPVMIPVGLMIKLVFKTGVGQAERDTIRHNAIAAIGTYVNGTDIGEPVIVNEIIQVIMDSNDKILDFDIYKMTVDNKDRYISNIEAKWNEKFILGEVEIT